MKHKIVAIIGGTVAFAIVAALVAIAVLHHDEVTPTGPPPTVPPGAAPFEVVRPFAPEVAWNRPVSDFGPSERYADYAQRLWQYGSFGGWTETARRGVINIEFRNYSVPIYDARQANETKRFYTASFGYPPSPGFSLDVPWNDYWQPAPGSDGIMLILNPDTGETWNLWVVLRGNPSSCLTADNLSAGFRPFVDMCAGGATMLDNADGTVGDYRTWNSYDSERGAGIPKLALVTTPYEVRAGVIEHALELTVFNTMFGPACGAGEIDSDAAGDTCGFYVPPATRIEWATTPPTSCGANNQPATPEYRRKTVPEGMRFALDITDAEIDAWLDQRGYTGAKRSTARIFAVALRDYGMIIGETGCYGMSIEVDGFVNPEAMVIWNELGIADDTSADSLLDGLFTEERIYVVEPAPLSDAITAPTAGLKR